MTYLLSLITLLFSLSAWAAPETAAQPGAQGLGVGMFLPMILIFVVFYFLLVRPQQKQAKEREKTLGNLQKGDEVLLTSGIYGKITGVADQALTIEIADNVRIKAARSAVQGLASGIPAPTK